MAMTPRQPFTLRYRVRSWASLHRPDGLTEAVPADPWL